MELKQFLRVSSAGFNAGFNRTFMELKQRNVTLTKIFKEVLIGPSWN